MGLFGKRKGDALVEETSGDANPPTFDPQASRVVEKTREEKMFLLKLDIFLLTYGCLSCVALREIR